ncbi:MAG: serine hydrolase domain-containing protein [Porphyromonas sp.]|nr:serine hydrolase domain-containing protein [Porphyromonas sp.]
MKRVISLTAIIVAFYSLAVRAQDESFLRLNRFLDMVEQDEMVMGSISVYRSGEEICSRAIGFRDVEHQIKADVDTRYRIASISKTFCAVAVLRLAEEGKLSLQDTLSRYFPNLQGASRITIEQLLRHRSGLRNYLETSGYISWKQEQHTKEQLLERIKTAGLSFETPDSKAEYSNSNYVLLAMIAEQVSGKSYSELLGEYIIEPLKLSSTRVERNIDRKKNEAPSYRNLSGWSSAGYTDSSVLLGTGDIISTPKDLNRFIFALMNGSLLSPKSLEKMLELKDNYGMGILPLRFQDKKAFGHTGGIDGYASAVFYFPDTGYSYAYTFNGVKEDLATVVAGLLSAIHNQPWQKSKADSPDMYDRYTGVYASKEFPFPLFVGVQEGKLMAQALGQQAFPLKGTGEGVYVFVPAAIRIVFYPEKGEMLFLQGSLRHSLKKISKP